MIVFQWVITITISVFLSVSLHPPILQIPPKIQTYAFACTNNNT